MNDYNFDKYIKSIEQETVVETKEVKIARLVLLLHRIERELATTKETLTKLQFNSVKYNRKLLPEIEQKIETVDRLSLKISRARLNLNYHFI